ncbi:MAG: hypothetical protein C0617_05865 [Desulfuromonas sp.]|uniref:chemotaxis protein CheX n=1 Tax=Desulfuromonas sp. TaxID=892 RepID=UPI000CAB5750|nr:chemotaxis protein CheX [Desulfuromonas sp.]PLX84979.1 MAG: hypothetical protein C0617_05865 [Desulfuromonas sp.]
MSPNTGAVDEALVRSVTETLENMVFAEINPSEEKAWAASADPALWASLPLLVPLYGNLWLGMPRSLLVRVVTMAYALPEEELADRMLNDTLAEILNTLAGRLLNLLVPAHQTFRLGLPETGKAPGTSSEETLRHWYFALEDDPFCVVGTGDFLDPTP